ncbi:ATP-binding cassette domain-containing protein [Paenibacillus sp. HJL G12]|uniref:ATP-binding cassette domain-containing protein n=1 Tax=Paenibacillus dendrobii TaxID=2691084 RepID=A0A7X3LIA2_9BACL|nr:ABC transporter ATP-binding protein [Paenibacillus dendrobii]MWV44363.1 ATP-binding cassette domain-containing protein [Paenibacillus dendrobii]
MIEVSGVGKQYGDITALNRLDWAIGEGEWWGIIGPNGSGKSTLMRLLSGVEQLSEGAITIRGVNIADYSRKQLSRMMAVLQQEGIAPVHYPVREVLEMGRYPYLDWLGRDSKDDVDTLIEGIMDKLELHDLAERPLDELSGGQRQRVALGQVMAQEPQILLLDEPTTFLDIHYQQQFMELVAKWRKEAGITVIAVLHDLNLAALYCDKLLVLRDGRAVGSGTPAEMLTAERIGYVYEVDPVVVAHPSNGVPQILLTRQV